MQTSFKYSLLLSIAVIFLFASCSKSNDEGRWIPKGAAFAIKMDGESLNSKLPWEEIKKSEIFKEAYSDSSTSALIRSVLDNPENTGIDVKKDIIFFAVKDSLGGYMAVEGTVKDEAKFKKFNSEAGKGLAVESEKDGIHFSNTPNMTSSWKKDKFILVMDAPMFNSMNNMARMRGGMYDDSTTTVDARSKRDMVPIATDVFNLKEDNSLGAEEKFTDLMKTKGDIHFWVNTELLAASGMSGGAMGPLSMINMAKLYEGSRMTGVVNFENGKIVVDFKSYSGKEISELVKKYSGDKIDAEMVKRIPSKNVAAMMALNFKPEGVREYLKVLGLEGFVNMGAPMLGFSLDDFIKANKGDILLAVTDVKMDTAGKPELSVLFSASVGDKASFNKLVDAGKRLMTEKFGGGASQSVFFNMNEKYFSLSNKKEYTDQYISTAGSNDFDFFDKMKGSAGGVYINFQYLLQTMGSAVSADSFQVAVKDASLKVWDNLVAYGEGFKAGGSLQHIEVNMVDKSTNSLKQLNNYLGTMGAIKKKQDDMYRNKPPVEVIVDTVEVGH